jgi:hypothetical protein
MDHLSLVETVEGFGEGVVRNLRRFRQKAPHQLQPSAPFI